MNKRIHSLKIPKLFKNSVNYPKEGIMHQLFRILAVLAIISLSPAIGLSQKASEKDAKHYNDLGLQDIKKGRYDQAINNLNKAIKLNPDYILQYRIKACILISLKQFEDALLIVENALKLSPNDKEIKNVKNFIIKKKDKKTKTRN